MSIGEALENLHIVAVLVVLNFSSVFAQDEKIFGQQERLNHAFKGEVYLLPDNTNRLPNFDTLKSVGSIYSSTIDVSPRDWQSGFPGVTDRFEWFAIVYKSSFTVKEPGTYTFRLLSDDGSKLFIDDSLIVNNDGVHGPYSESGEVDLDGSSHTMEVQYFQGPRAGIALQLFAGAKGSPAAIFPTSDFALSTPGLSRAWLWLLVPLLALLAYAVRQHTKKQRRVRVVITSPGDRSMFPCGTSITFSAETVPPGRQNEIQWEVPLEQQQDQSLGTGSTFSVTWRATGIKQVVARLDGSADDVILFLYKTQSGKLTVRDILGCEPPEIQRSAFDYSHYRAHSIPENANQITG